MVYFRKDLFLANFPLQKYDTSFYDLIVYIILTYYEWRRIMFSTFCEMRAYS